MIKYFKTVGLMAILMATCHFDLWAADAKASPTSAAATDPSLLIYYPFDKDDGEVAKDMSPKSLYSGLVRGGKWEQNGRVGGCFTFNGEDSNRIDIDLSSMPELKAYTIELWVKHKKPKSGDFCRLFEEGKHIAFWINFNEGSEGNLWHMIAFEPGDYGTPIKMPEPLPVDKWNHVAATWDGKVIKIFLNGVQQQGEEPRAGKMPTLDYARIGWLLDGSVDEFKFYNRALSADEIKKHFEAVK